MDEYSRARAATDAGGNCAEQDGGPNMAMKISFFCLDLLALIAVFGHKHFNLMRR